MLLAPLAVSLGVAALSPRASAAVTDTKVGGTLTDLLGATNDLSSLSTTTSGSVIQMTGTGFTTQAFTGITQIDVDFNGAGQILTLNSANFSFTPTVTIVAGAGAATDEVVKNGINTVTLTGSSTYADGTFLNGGTLIFNSSTSLGTGAVSLAGTTELRGSATETLANAISFAANAAAEISTTGTLTLNGAITDGANSDLIFGSTGHAGTIIVGTGASSASTSTSVDIEFGTVRNGGGLGLLTAGTKVTNVHAGATLSLNDQSMTINNLQGSGSVTLGTKASTVLTLVNGGFGGVISGAGSILTTNSQVVDLTGANTYTGGTSIVFSSVLTIGNGTTGSIAGNVADNGSFGFQRSNAVSFAGLISGTGDVVQEGTGVLTLTGKNTYSGGTDIEKGVLVAGNSNAVGTSTIQFLGSGELRGSGTETLTNAITFNHVNATISSNGTLTLNGAISDGNDTSVASGLIFGSTGNAGTVVIGPVANSANLATSIDVAFGTVRNGGGLGLLTFDAATTNVHAGATLSVNDFTMTISDLEGAGSVTLGTKATTTLTLGGTDTFSGVISGAGQVKTAADKTITLTGANTYTGGTTIPANSALIIGSNGTTGAIAGAVSDSGDLSFDRGNALTFAGAITGTGTLVQEGSGVLTLTGNNSGFSGGTTIDKGVLVAGNSNALGTGSVKLLSGAELRGSGTVTLANAINFPTGQSATISSTGTLTLNGAITDGAASTLVFGSTGNAGVVVIGTGASSVNANTAVDVAFGTLRNGGNLNLLTSTTTSTTVEKGATLSVNDVNMTINSLEGAGSVTLGTKATTTLQLGTSVFGGVISGAGMLETTDSNGVVFTGANTYTGGTTIVADSAVTIGNGGTTGSIVGNVADSGIFYFRRSNALTFAGIISGTGGVTQEGTGVLTLSGNNSYSGNTVINSGVVAVSNNNALGSSLVSLATGAELRGTGTVTLANKVTLTAAATISSTGTLTLDGALSNSGGVTFGSPGNAGTVVVASLSNTEVGASPIDVAFGTLRNGGNLNSLTSGVGPTTVHPGATLSVNDHNMTIGNLEGAGSVTLGTKATTLLTLEKGTFQGIISGAGMVQTTASDTMTLTGANTYTGGTTIPSMSVLQIGAGGTTGSIAGYVTDNGTLNFDRSNALTYAGKISGNGSLTQSGTGVLTLSGSNSFGGGTTIAAGVIAINNGSALGTGTVTLDAGTELRGTGTVTLNNELDFASNATTTVSTTGTLDLADVQFSAANQLLKIGSTGNAGTVVFGPSTVTEHISGSASIDVAFGTVRNNGSLGDYTSSIGSTEVDKGATLSVNDISISINDLLGAGTITLGTKVAATLTLGSGNFSGPITGSGQVTKNVANSLLSLAGASTYTGGTTLQGGTTLANNTTGSATGSGPVSIESGATLGGRGTVSGTMTLLSGGTILPSAGTPGIAGTKFHGSSLLWDSGGTLTFQIGATADELLLTGALTKNPGGAYTIDIEDAGIVGDANYTLITFSSSNFITTDFNLELPTNFNGMLVKNGTSLVLENLTHSDLPAGGHEMASAVPGTTQSMSVPTIGADPSVNPTVQGVPEPGSATLLLLGLGGFLTRRRRVGV